MHQSLATGRVSQGVITAHRAREAPCLAGTDYRDLRIDACVNAFAPKTSRMNQL